jgi:iron complex outermembrane receptor protein
MLRHEVRAAQEKQIITGVAMKLSHQGAMRRAIYWTSLVGLAGTTAARPGLAADASSDGQAAQLEGVSITGSRIRRIETEGATPVEVITAKQIADSGFVDIQQLFDNLSLNVGGSVARNRTQGFTPGASGVDLRGLGIGRTLVLIDGRRLPVYPIASNGTDNFVDLASIPTSIVDRIEILTSGGSAIYGSDAISGVINIITRKHLKGFEGSARVGGTEHGGYSNERFELSYGFSNDRDSLLVSGQYFHNDPLNATQRYYSKSDRVPHIGIVSNYSVFGASYIDFENGVNTPAPMCGPNSPIGPGLVPTGDLCGFDRAKSRQLFPATDQSSLAVRFEHGFDSFSVYVSGLYNDTNTEARVEPFGYQSPLIPTGAPNAPTGGYGYFYRRAIEFGRRGSNTDNLSARLLLGLKGEFSGYDWDVGLTRAQQRSNDSFPSIISTVLDDFVCGGSVIPADQAPLGTRTCGYAQGNGLNLLDPIPPGVVDAGRYQRSEHAVSQITLLDATISGPVAGLRLPGGAVQAAAYAGFQREYYSDLSDPISASGAGVDGGTTAAGNRSHGSAAVELNLPITSKLSVSTAGRFDKYNTIKGGDLTGQGAIQYRPMTPLLLRASIGSTFRAPDLQRTGGKVLGFENVIDTVQCIQNGGSGAGDQSVPACINAVPSVPVSSTGGALKSERGTNYSFGVVAEPIEKLTVSIDYFYIQLRNEVENLSGQTILDACASQGTLCGLIERDMNGNLNNGLLVEDPLNAAGHKVKGVDGKMVYSFEAAPLGNFVLTSAATYMFSDKFQVLSTQPAIQRLGYTAIPRYRLNSQIGWSRGPFGGDITYLYVPKIPGANTAYPAASNQFLQAFDQVNVQVRYEIGKLGMLRAGVNNVFDSHPPFDPTDTQNQFAYSGVAQAFSNALGREGFLQYEFKF